MLAVQNKNSANFVEWIPNNVKVFYWESTNIEFWNEKKIMWSRWPSVTSLLAGFPWLQHLLATPLPYRCHQFNVIPFLRNLMTPFIKLCFRKSSREFRSSSQQCSAGRLFCTGIQVNRIVQCTTRMEKKSTRFFRGGNGWDGIHGSREQHERFGNSFLKEWKQQISPVNVYRWVNTSSIRMHLQRMSSLMKTRSQCWYFFFKHLLKKILTQHCQCWYWGFVTIFHKGEEGMDGPEED